MKTTQKLKLAIISLFILVEFNSCCTKKACMAVDLNQIELYNFSEDEIDSVIVFSYNKNSNFAQALDSIALPANYNGTYFTIQINNFRPKEIEYKLEIKNISKSYTIGNFQFAKEKCNKCFPFTPKSDYYEYIKSYSVNSKQESGIIKIYK